MYFSGQFYAGGSDESLSLRILPGYEQMSLYIREITHYLGKISQPLLERIDICTEVPAVSFSKMKKKIAGESSAQIRKRVEAVQEIQRERYKKEKFCFNGELDGRKLEKYCVMTGGADKLLEQAYEQFQFSTRAYHKILKTARTMRIWNLPKR